MSRRRYPSVQCDKDMVDAIRAILDMGPLYGPEDTSPSYRRYYGELQVSAPFRKEVDSETLSSSSVC